MVSSMLSFTTASLYTCTYLLVQCSIFSVYLSLFSTGTKHSRSPFCPLQLVKATSFSSELT